MIGSARTRIVALMGALVLIAETDPFNLRLLSDVCEAAGWDVATAFDLPSALEIIARKRPDLTLVDEGLGEPGGGLELLSVLKQDPELAPIPVLVTLTADDDASKQRAVELGAEDYVARPYRVFEVHHRIRNALRRVDAERRVGARDDDELLDPLTRTGSGVQMQITLEYEMTRAVRYGHPLSCVSLEIGALEGGFEALDAVNEGTLIQLVATVRTCIRAIDHLFRGGASELVIVLPETSADDASVVVSRLAERAERGELLGAAAPAGVQVEIGVAARGDDLSEGPALLRAARQARVPVQLSASSR